MRPVALHATLITINNLFLYSFPLTILSKGPFFISLQTLSKGKAINTEALKKFVSRRKWQVRDVIFTIWGLSTKHYSLMPADSEMALFFHFLMVFNVPFFTAFTDQLQIKDGHEVHT